MIGRTFRLRGMRFAYLAFALLLGSLLLTVGAAMAVFQWRSSAMVEEDHRQAVEALHALTSTVLDQDLRTAEQDLIRLRNRLQGIDESARAAMLRSHLHRPGGDLVFHALVLAPAEGGRLEAVDSLTLLPDGWVDALAAPPQLSFGWQVQTNGEFVALVRTLPLYEPVTGRQAALLHGAVVLTDNQPFLARLRQATGADGYAILLGDRLVAATLELGSEGWHRILAEAGEACALAGHRRIPCSTVPFPRTEAPSLRVAGYETASALLSLRQALQGDMLALLVLAVAAGLAAAVLIGRLVTRPMARLMAYARQIHDGSPGVPPAPCGIHELDLLATLLTRTMGKLREREEDLAITLQSIGDAVMAVDPQERVTRMNPVAEQLTGWTLAEAAGKPLAEVLDIRHPKTLQPLPGSARRVLREGHAVSQTQPVSLRSRDGTPRQILDSAAPIRGPGGGVKGGVIIFRDVTQEQEAREARLEAEQRLSALCNNLSTGMVYQLLADRLTGERRFLYVSEGVERLHGLSPADVLADSGKIYGQIHEDDRARLAEHERRNLAGFARFSEEVRMCLPSGDVRWSLLSAMPRRVSDHEVVWDGIEVDITDRRRAEEEREKLQHQLAQAQKMESVGRLAGGVAHDFNNMLGVILGFTEMALESVPPGEPLHAGLLEIRKAADRSADLTRQLLAFARKQTVAPKVIELNPTIEGMLNMLERIIGEHIRLEWRPGAETGPVRIDPTQIDQILVNLCVNARDAIGNGGRVVIETGAVRLDEAACAEHPGALPGDYVRLDVRDDGCGMDPETLAHIFEPFFSTKGPGEGTGLGLATVYGIVKQNRGFIRVTSEPARGTTFTVLLPRHDTAAAAAASGGDAAPSVGQETILLVEDDPALLGMTSLMLQRLGYTLLPADSPGEALRRIREHDGTIDLLLTDVILPGMNGRDLAEQVRAERPGLRCLFMSGYTADVIASHGVLMPGVHFIQKPFTLVELGDKIRAVFGDGRPGAVPDAGQRNANG